MLKYTKVLMQKLIRLPGERSVRSIGLIIRANPGYRAKRDLPIRGLNVCFKDNSVLGGAVCEPSGLEGDSSCLLKLAMFRARKFVIFRQA